MVVSASTNELKLPSEATPTSFAIQNQIQAVWALITVDVGGFLRRVGLNKGVQVGIIFDIYYVKINKRVGPNRAMWIGKPPKKE